MNAFSLLGNKFLFILKRSCGYQQNTVRNQVESSIAGEGYSPYAEAWPV